MYIIQNSTILVKCGKDVVLVAKLARLRLFVARICGFDSRSLLRIQEHVWTILLLLHFGIMIVCKTKGYREKVRRYSRHTDQVATRDSNPQPFSLTKGSYPLDYIANLIWMGRTFLG